MSVALKFQHWLSESLSNLKDYPFTILSSIVSTGIFIALKTEIELDFSLFRWATLFLLCVPLFFGLENYASNTGKNKYPLIICGILIAAYVYFFQIPSTFQVFQNKNTFIRLGLVQAIFVLFAAVFPYFHSKNYKDFWYYNKSVFLSIVTAFIYTFTLTLGLLLALAAIENLFGVHIKSSYYKNVWVACNIFCNTFIFLSRIPTKTEIENDTDYPQPLKIFALYVLLPLIVLYLFILFAYQIKIVLAWSLPKGWVSTMVLAFGVFGIFAFLLLYPVKQLNIWITRFTRAYYWLLLPLVILLLVAIYVRIDTYGVTELRYMVAILGIWLLGIALYFIFSKKDNIKVIPLSLLGVLMISLISPFNAFNVSIHNQEKRLNRGVELKKANKNLNKIESRQLSGAIDYLSQNNIESFKKYLTAAQYKTINKEQNFNKAYKIREYIGVKDFQEENENRYFNAEKIGSVEKLYKADYSIDISRFDTMQIIEIDKATTLEYIAKTDKISFKINDSSQEISLNGLELLENGMVEIPDRICETDDWTIRLKILRGDIEHNKLISFNGKLFLTKKGK